MKNIGLSETHVFGLAFKGSTVMDMCLPCPFIVRKLLFWRRKHHNDTRKLPI